MDIHEYQAKEILSGFGVPVPKGGIAYGPEQAGHRARDLGGSVWAVKAQVHSGGRGEAGGVKICRTEDEVIDFSADLLGSKLVTKQSGKRGRIVGRLYVEEGTEIDREIYLGLILDRESERVVVAGSAEGGMEIEEIAEKRPETIKRVIVDPALGMRDFQARELAFELGLNASQIAEATRIITGCYRAFRELDATMVEINPLVVTKAGNLIALDAKMSFDDNALFRRQKISELRDKTQEDPLESHAQDRGLSYVGLDGNIGCMINGAGLAMATLDMIKLSGGEPANFLDVGGGASPERILMAFKAVLKNPRVEAILVNIFAGINRCDWVAEGVVKAYEQLDLKLPVVVRLAGTNVEKGREILNNANLPIIVADTLADAAEKAVAATRKEA